MRKHPPRLPVPLIIRLRNETVIAIDGAGLRARVLRVRQPPARAVPEDVLPRLRLRVAEAVGREAHDGAVTPVLRGDPRHAGAGEEVVEVDEGGAGGEAGAGVFGEGVEEEVVEGEGGGGDEPLPGRLVVMQLRGRGESWVWVARTRMKRASPRCVTRRLESRASPWNKNSWSSGTNLASIFLFLLQTGRFEWSRNYLGAQVNPTMLLFILQADIGPHGRPFHQMRVSGLWF